MQITRVHIADALVLEIDGRLDAAWAEHLDTNLADSVRQGHHQLRLDLSRVTFISSAGIAVVMKFHKQLARIEGSLLIVQPSEPVRTVLEITRLSDILVAAGAPVARPASATGRRVELSAGAFEAFDLAPGSLFKYRVLGTDEPLRTGGFTQDDCVTMACPDSVFALGVGAFGDSFADCRDRFGEFLSVAGAAAYQPADGTDAPDYLVASGARSLEPRLLYGLACEGKPARLARFERAADVGPIGLVDLAASCLELSEAPAAGVIVVAEAAGLVGAALRRSPALDPAARDLFAHPGVRDWLSFTAELAFAGTTVLAAGVVARRDAAQPSHEQLRPLGRRSDLLGHFHAAAFTFRPLQRGLIDVKDTVIGLFENEELLGVLHLLNDDRSDSFARESTFIRGACWIGALASRG